MESWGAACTTQQNVASLASEISIFGARLNMTRQNSGRSGLAWLDDQYLKPMAQWATVWLHDMNAGASEMASDGEVAKEHGEKQSSPTRIFPFQYSLCIGRSQAKEFRRPNALMVASSPQNPQDQWSESTPQPLTDTLNRETKSSESRLSSTACYRCRHQKVQTVTDSSV